MTDLPGNVIYRVTNDPDLIANFTKLMLDPTDKRYHVETLVIISYQTDARPDAKDTHLHANNFQLVFGYNNFSTWLVN